MMLRIVLILILIVGLGLAAHGCGEAETYDIIVVNDVYLFDHCDVYLDGKFQFTTKTEESAIITDVSEGRHTITCQSEGTVISEETFEVSQNTVTKRFSVMVRVKQWKT